MNINWVEVAAAAFSLFFAHTASVRLGAGTLSAAETSGAPAHLTVANVFTAASLAFRGVQDSITSGDVVLTYTPDAALLPTSA